MPVLQRKELEASPLADLHAIASELGSRASAACARPTWSTRSCAARAASPRPTSPSPTRSRRTRRSRRRPPRSRRGRGRGRGEDEDEDEPERRADEDEPEPDEEPAAEEELATGVLDVLPNGSGFLRADPAGQSRDDVYVSPAQIRRCELRAGDEVSGPVRPPRRNERHPSLVRVETVNGADAEPPEERPLVRRPHTGLPDRAAVRARGARGRALRPGLARGDRRASRLGGHQPAARDRVRARLREPDGRPRRGAPRGGRRVGRRRGRSAAAASTARPSRRPRPRSWPSSAPSGAWSAAGTPSWSSTPSTRSRPAPRRRVFGAGRATSRRAGRSPSSPSPARAQRPCAGPPRASCSSPAGESRAAKVAGAQSGTLRADRLT